MKRLFAVILSLLLLTSCGGPEEERKTAIPAEEPEAVSEPEQTQETPEESEAPEAPEEESIPDEGTETAFCEYEYASIRLEIPEGWDWEASPYSEETGLLGIRFWPAGQDGAAALYCWTGGFGVCGTGLSEEEVTFDNGLRAMMGTYDTEECWNFISFRNVPGDYAVINEGCGSWWPEFGEQAMRILGTAEFGDRAMSYEEMAEIAGGLDTPDAEGFWGYYEVLSGVWTIRFYGSGGTETLMTACIDNDGNVLRNAE